jgi:hypothetical protein
VVSKAAFFNPAHLALICYRSVAATTVAATTTGTATTAAAATGTATAAASTAAAVGATETATTAAAFTATAAASTAAETTTAAAEAAGTGRTCLHRTGFVDDNATATQRSTVHAADGSLCFWIAGHFDKAEALRTTGVTFHHYFSAGDCAILAKGLFQIAIANRVRQIADVQFVAHEGTPINT